MDAYPLRTAYLIVRKRAAFIGLVALVFALLALVISHLLSPTYKSYAVFSLIENQSDLRGRDVYGTQSTSITGVLISIGIKPTAIIEGFKARMNTEDFARRLGERRVPDWARVFFDERKGFLKLEARGPTPQKAKERAEILANVAMEDFVEESVRLIRTQLVSETEELRTTLASLQQQLSLVEQGLKSLGKVRVSTDVGVTLKAAGVDPMVAESSDPALAYLRLELARLKADVAAKSSRLHQLEAWLGDQGLLKRLAESRLPLKLVASPGVPLEPVAPKPLLNTVIAFFLGFFLAVFWAFLQAALEPPKEGEVAESPPTVSG